MAYIKPIRPIIVVPSSKVESFCAQKPDLIAKQKRKEIVAIFRANGKKIT